jgi:RNA polymerase sigma-70 factor (ECF subfamily)
MTEKEYNLCVTEYADNVYRFIVKNLRHEEDARMWCKAPLKKCAKQEGIDAKVNHCLQ